jgi:hypothetical protein
MGLRCCTGEIAPGTADRATVSGCQCVPATGAQRPNCAKDTSAEKWTSRRGGECDSVSGFGSGSLHHRCIFDRRWGEFHYVITTLISKMINPAILSHGLCQLYFSQYSTHRPTMGGESKSHDESTEPAEAANTRTACRGDPSGMRSLWTNPGTHRFNRGRKVQCSLSFPWVITLNERTSAVVVYVPGGKEQPVAAPWFEETD